MSRQSCWKPLFAAVRRQGFNRSLDGRWSVGQMPCFASILPPVLKIKCEFLCKLIRDVYSNGCVLFFIRGRDLNSSLMRSRMRLVCLLALVIFCIVLTGKSFAQDSELSADEIIQILQENPDVLAEAKAEIVSQLRDRGYNVSENEITDERLFNQIRSDDRVRQLAANELAKRGFGPAQENEQMPDEQIVPSGQQPSQQNNPQAGQQNAQQNNQSFS